MDRTQLNSVDTFLDDNSFLMVLGPFLSQLTTQQCVGSGMAPRGVGGGGGGVGTLMIFDSPPFIFLLVSSAVSHVHDDNTPTPL